MISITQYCTIHNIDADFIDALAEEGLIVLTIATDGTFIEEEQLSDLESYTRWHYEMGVNTAGIDVIRHLLGRMRDMQSEMDTLRMRLRLYENLKR